MAKRKGSTFERLRKGEKLNRRERREVADRLNSVDAGLDRESPRRRFDIGNRNHYVAVPPGRDEQPVREFGCWTADLEKTAEWRAPGSTQPPSAMSVGAESSATLANTAPIGWGMPSAWPRNR